jgi:hypothetical protein
MGEWEKEIGAITLFVEDLGPRLSALPMPGQPLQSWGVG